MSQAVLRLPYQLETTLLNVAIIDIDVQGRAVRAIFEEDKAWN